MIRIPIIDEVLHDVLPQLHEECKKLRVLLGQDGWTEDMREVAEFTGQDYYAIETADELREEYLQMVGVACISLPLHKMITYTITFNSMRHMIKLSPVNA